MNADAIQERLISFLRTVTGNSTLDATTDLHASGATDSLTMMDLLVCIESEFCLRLEFTDLTPETFRTVETLSALIFLRKGTQHVLGDPRASRST